MCGIVGIIAKGQQGFWQTHLDIFQQMLVADSIRGTDSTGMFYVSRSNGVEALKHDTHPYNTFLTKAWSKWEKGAIREAKILVGHNRAATKGNINNDNAHPFLEKHIALVHNGTLYNHKEVSNTEVDSHAIAKGFADDGWKPTLKKINGAWALVWYDQRDKILRLTNNGDRPLSLLECQDVILFGSEMGMLQWLAQRNRLTYDVKNIHFVKKHELLEISLDSTHRCVQSDLTEELVKPPAAPFPQGQSHHGFPQHSAGGTDIKPTEGKSTPSKLPLILSGASPQTSDVFDLATMQKWYPTKLRVMFQPYKIDYAYSDGSPRYKVFGTCYRPNLPPLPARGILPGTVNSLEKAVEFCGEKLYGYVSHWMSDRDGSQVVVESMEQTCNLSTWNDQIFAYEEFEMLMEDVLCDKCAGELDINFMDTTSITQRGTVLGAYRCVCHHCVAKNRADMPDEMQAQLEGVVNAK